MLEKGKAEMRHPQAALDPEYKHLGGGGGCRRAWPSQLAGHKAEREEARGIQAGSVLSSPQVTMRGAMQVSIMFLLVTVSDCAVITGVSRLTFSVAWVLGRCQGLHGL